MLGKLAAAFLATSFLTGTGAANEFSNFPSVPTNDFAVSVDDPKEAPFNYQYTPQEQPVFSIRDKLLNAGIPGTIFIGGLLRPIDEKGRILDIELIRDGVGFQLTYPFLVE